ncbi:protoporphyrinogen oxidase [Chitinophaga defluvii]|uniref:Coproporphyrinogen III oxidase n=1 Tax=Chitinophaga defluvii TaxID=3163343 RepID=A0ABV2SYH5_9BACT
MKEQPVLIVGAGISGLSIAYELQKQQIPYTVLEAGPDAGGVIQSFHKDGFELDAGPNTLAATTETLAFIQELGLTDQMLEATAASKKRYLVRNSQLHTISPNPLKILTTGYLSRNAKWRLFTESFRKPVIPVGEESVANFINRRFGKEIADYLLDPILSGIYAGNLDLLSVEEVLPALPKWEKQYGSVTKGLMKEKGAMAGRKIINFKGGNGLLVKRLRERLQTPVRFNCTVSHLEPAPDGYLVKYTDNGQPAELTARRVVFATPAYATAANIHQLDPTTAAKLNKVPYPRMGVLHLGFDAAALKAPLEGFGFLVPAAEKKHFLGSICNSAIFPSKAPEGKILFTVFIGGARQEKLFDVMSQAALQENVLREFRELLQLSDKPVMQHFSVWEHAIPQLNVGHAAIRKAVDTFQQKFPGLHISGNYLCGVAIPALLQHARTLAMELMKK